MATLESRLKVGDTRPFFDAQLFDPLGQPLNLTGLSVVFRMKHKVTGAIKINDAAMTIVDAPTGQIQYQWATVDTDTEAEYDAWAVVDHGGGVLESFPNQDSHSVRIER